jgi:hypothetical protein
LLLFEFALKDGFFFSFSPLTSEARGRGCAHRHAVSAACGAQRDERAAEGHRDTISEAGSPMPPPLGAPERWRHLQIGNAVPTLPLHVLPVHWSVPHSLPVALSLVLSLAHAHNHTQTEVYIRPLEWDMILLITSYIRDMYVCMCYILTHIHTRIGTGGTHTPTAAT